jgi:hypothetical protein
VLANETNDDNIDAMEQYTGEIHTIRALAYSELVKCFCKAYDPATAAAEKGVVLRTSYFKKEPIVRASLESSYRFILEDLAEAEARLDIDNDSYSSVGITLAAAYALHARVALHMQDWDAAIDYSSRLIDHPNGAFALSSASSVYTNGQTYFDYMWTNDLSTEVIWQVEYTVTSYGGALGQVFLNFNNDYVYCYPDYVPSQWVLDLYTSGDARYSAYFTNLQTGYAHALTYPLLTKYFGNESFIANIIYHVSKPKPLRLAEQYLIRAEAYCQKGRYADASSDLAALNQARGAKAATLNASNWLDVISDERVKELYMEGFRLNDLKRWNKGFERTHQAYTQPEGSSKKIEAGDYRFVWPIPQNDIEAPGSEIIQNKGYGSR